MLLSEAKRILRKNGYKIMDEGLFSRLFRREEKPTTNKPVEPERKTIVVTNRTLKKLFNKKLKNMAIKLI